MTDKAKGKMKEAAGAFTCDEEKKAEGRAQQRAGAAAEEAGQQERTRGSSGETWRVCPGEARQPRKLKVTASP